MRWSVTRRSGSSSMTCEQSWTGFKVAAGDRGIMTRDKGKGKGIRESEDSVKKLLATLVIGASFCAPLHAELKYTMHMEIKKTAAPAQPVNPMIGIMGDAVMKQMVPEGAADLVYLVGDKGGRVEYLQAAMGLPAG